MILSMMMMMIYLRLGGARWPLITVRVLGAGLGLGEATLDTEVITELGSGSGERLVSSCNMGREVTTSQCKYCNQTRIKGGGDGKHWPSSLPRVRGGGSSSNEINCNPGTLSCDITMEQREEPELNLLPGIQLGNYMMQK